MLSYVINCPQLSLLPGQALPAYLTKSTFKKDQQMLSAQMLTGIPEVSSAV